MSNRKWLCALVAFIGVATDSAAAQTAVPIAAFPAGSTILTFAGLVDGTEVNGLTLGGVLFTYSLGNGNVVIDGGPGVTNNVAPPNIVSVGSPAGILRLTLPGTYSTFGYGFAVLSGSSLASATTISLYSGATNVGSLTYAAAPDPIFAGGFAGIHSDAPFDRVDITFDAAVAPAFALDDIRLAATVVPEPATLVLVGGGLLGLGGVAIRRRCRAA